MLIFKRNYFLATILLFFVEIFIAVHVRDQIIRPYIGDLLVVILLYCFLMSFVNLSVEATGFLVLVFAYVVEYFQFLNILSLLGLQDNAFANVVFGSQFEWADMLAYTLGLLLILIIEEIRNNRKRSIGKLSS